MGWSPKQQALYDSHRRTDAQRIVVRGAKGAGKTEVLTWLTLRWALTHHQQQRVAMCTPGLAQFNGGILPAVERYCRRARREMHGHQDGFRVGSVLFVRIIASDIRSVRRALTLNLVGAYLCEFNEMPPEFVDEMVNNRVRLTDTRLTVCDYNPKGTRHWAETGYWDAPGWDSHQLGLADNPGLPADWIADRETIYLPGTAKHRRWILGEPADDEGRVYKHIVWGQPPTKQPSVLWAGVDVGNSMDHPTHGVLFGEWADGQVWLLDEWRYPTDPADTDRTPEWQASEMVRRFSAHGPVAAWYVDPAALYMQNSLARHGAANVAKADNTISDGIEVVDALFTRRILRVATDRTPYLDDELLNYVVDANGDPIIDPAHGPDAVRYGVMGRNRSNLIRQITTPSDDIAASILDVW